LNINRVGAHDNFFALSGDSLRATQVISRVRSLFSVNLPISTAFLKTSVLSLQKKLLRPWRLSIKIRGKRSTRI
jgi:hypothetical protein